MRVGWILWGGMMLLLGELRAAETIASQQAYAPLAPRAQSEVPVARPQGLAGRVFCGYQGWFRAEGDGAGLGFSHYTQRGKFEPGQCSIDLWPDLSEYTAEEKFATPFRHADGSVAHVFSSVHPATVDRHFKWMADFDLDGAFVQRFAVLGAKKQRSYRKVWADNRKLMLCRDAANRHGRCYALMYDLSGMHDDDFERLAQDWKQLRRNMQLGTDPNDGAYLQLNGKPLVAIWGVGFKGRAYSLEKTAWFIRLLKHNPEWGGMSIMLGVPYHWREQGAQSDAVTDPELHDVLAMADVLSPWSVGRYRNEREIVDHMLPHQQADRHWCASRKINYLPVLFPGFSWRNMQGSDEGFIPRNKGHFFWQQFVAARAAGGDAAYIAMFDEIDEGTAIFKCTNNPPVGASLFQTYEGLPPDHYLWLSREGRRLLRGALPVRTP